MSQQMLDKKEDMVMFHQQRGTHLGPKEMVSSASFNIENWCWRALKKLLVVC
jgi:hypothetical protein